MIKQKRPHKIAMIGDCLSSGGAERVQALLSIYFESRDISVSHCIITDNVTYSYAGSLLNLGKIAPSSFFAFRKIKRFMALRNFIRQNNFDHIIDFRMRTGILQEMLIASIYPKGSIYTVHSSILEYYFPQPDSISKSIYKNHRIVGVSNAIRENVLQRQLSEDVTRIYNPVTIAFNSESAAPEFEYILAIGRMNDDVKQFDKLIESYAETTLPVRGIKLMLLGEGQNQTKFRQLAKKLGVEALVEFKGFVDDPFPYYKNALFQILSSKREGLPMGIIEALSVGTPVIAFDCVSGPSEIISHRQNGLLIENQNFKALTIGMNEMVNDIVLYNHCKANAKQSAEKFSIDAIGQQWLEYLKIDVS